MTSHTSGWPPGCHTMPWCCHTQLLHWRLLHPHLSSITINCSYLYEGYWAVIKDKNLLHCTACTSNKDFITTNTNIIQCHFNMLWSHLGWMVVQWQVQRWPNTGFRPNVGIESMFSLVFISFLGSMEEGGQGPWDLIEIKQPHVQVFFFFRTP